MYPHRTGKIGWHISQYSALALGRNPQESCRNTRGTIKPSDFIWVKCFHLYQHVACSLCVTSPLHVASSSCVASSSPVALCVTCLHVSLSSGAVNGWWYWVFAAAHGAGPSSPFMAGGVVTALCHGQVVSSSSSMGWPTHHSPASMPCMWHGRSAHLLSGVHHHPGAANKVSEVGGNDNRVAAHIPQCPHHVRGMGALLVHYPACIIVLGLQTRLVRWGGNDDGWPLTFPGAPPHTWHGCSACLLPCLHLHVLH